MYESKKIQNDSGFHLVVKNNHWYDFNHLALYNPRLYPHLLVINFKTTINFSNQEALIELSTAILSYLFNLKWFTLRQHLCPRIPNRLNYVIWIHQMFGTEIKNVIDIGTGAGLIYPLLGNKMYQWKYTATQLDKDSFQNCQKLIQENGLLDQIILKKSNGELLQGIIDHDIEYDAIMCNPPFFEDIQNTISIMSEKEHHTEGGEYEFFFKIYCESLSFYKIKIWTMLIGRQTDFWIIKKLLEQEKRENIISEHYFGMILQGSNKRYIVAWRGIQVKKQGQRKIK